MSLNAWEQQALDSIKDGLTGSDPELAALLCAFTRLALDEEMPDGEKIRAGSRRARRRVRRARWRSSVPRAGRRLGLRRAMLLLLLLLLLRTAGVIAVVLAFSARGDHGACTETAAMICIDPAPGHSPGSSSRGTAGGQAPEQPAARTRQASPKVPPE